MAIVVVVVVVVFVVFVVVVAEVKIKVDLSCLFLLSAKGAPQPVDDQRRKSVQALTFRE